MGNLAAQWGTQTGFHAEVAWFLQRLLALEGGALVPALPGCLAVEESGHLSVSQVPPVSICKSKKTSAAFPSPQWWYEDQNKRTFVEALCKSQNAVQMKGFHEKVLLG